MGEKLVCSGGWVTSRDQCTGAAELGGKEDTAECQPRLEGAGFQMNQVLMWGSQPEQLLTTKYLHSVGGQWSVPGSVLFARVVLRVELPEANKTLATNRSHRAKDNGCRDGESPYRG